MIYENILQSLKSENRLRSIPDDYEGLDLVSNDYMGLGASYRDFLEEFRNRFSEAQMSASASRLLQRSQRYHNQLEARLDTLYNKKTLIFNSGYHANVGALSSLSLPKTLIVSDKLSHASMIDGIRLGKGDSARYPHNDMTSLRRILQRKGSDYEQVIIATESIFSMDGDAAPLQDLVEIKNEYPGTLLYLDEAHAFGVFGEKGLDLQKHRGFLMRPISLSAPLAKQRQGAAHS